MDEASRPTHIFQLVFIFNHFGRFRTQMLFFSLCFEVKVLEGKGI